MIGNGHNEGLVNMAFSNIDSRLDRNSKVSEILEDWSVEKIDESFCKDRIEFAVKDSNVVNCN